MLRCGRQVLPTPSDSDSNSAKRQERQSALAVSADAREDAWDLCLLPFFGRFHTR